MHESTQNIYNEYQEAKQKRGVTKSYSPFQQEPNQSTTSIKGIVLPSMYTLIHRDRLLRIELLNL